MKPVVAFWKNKIVKKFFFILLSVIFFFLLLFPRSVEIINQNPIFGFDQGREYIAVRNIVVNHKFILIGTELGAGSAGINGIFHGPGYYYLLTIPYIIFSGNPAGGTVLIFIFDVLSVGMLFYLVRKMFGLWPAIICAFLMAISPISIAQARFLWSPNPPALFIILSFYFTYLFKDKNKIFIFLAAFFAAFVYNFEMGIAIPLCLSLFIYSIFRFKTSYQKYLYLIGGFVFAFLPMFFFEVRHNFMGLRGIVSYVFAVKIHENVSGTNFLLDHFNAIIFNLNNSFNLQDILPKSLFYLPSIIFTFLIWVYLKKEKNKDFKHLIMYFIILPIITFVVFAGLKNALYNYYLTDLSIVYVISFGYLIWAALKNKDIRTLYILSLFVFFIVIYSIPVQFKITQYDLSDYGGTAKLKGKIDAIDYIYKDAKSRNFGLLVFSPPVYTYPYDYIIEWYGNKKYNYTPYKDEKGIFYLLIEPDPAKPWSYKGWLATVIKKGKIDYTKTLPSGFIIQKREIID